MLDHVLERVAEIHRGRRWILAFDAAAAAPAMVQALEEWGAAGIMVVAGVEGVGEIPDVPVHYTRTSAITIMEGLRAYEASLAQPEDALIEALDRFDPSRQARVIAGPVATFTQLAGRLVHGPRRPEWMALEDKTVIDSFWDAAGVPRAPSAVVPVNQAPEASVRLAGPRGTVWVADNALGWHGGGEYARWIPDAGAAAEGVEWFSSRSRSLRVMPFLDGLPCSIHGFVGSTGIGVFRPVEMLVLRRTDAAGLVYSGFSTYWDPPPEVREEMREVARRVAMHLRDSVGYLGGFSVDGVLVEEGFRPTELNPRASAGLGMQGRAADVPIGTLARCLAAGELDVDGAVLEQVVVPQADARRLGGPRFFTSDRRSPDKVSVTLVDGGLAPAGAAEDADGTMEVGEGVQGSFVTVNLTEGRIAPGPSLAPLAVSAANLARELWSLSIPPVEPAPNPFG